MASCTPSSPLPILPQSTPTPTVTSKCHYRGSGLFIEQDPVCTPGVIDPTITQGNIHSTICVPGWLDHNRPRPSITESNRLKRESMVEYGRDGDSPAKYEGDHLVARELGGLSASRPSEGLDLKGNFWAEPGGAPNPKDAVEDKLHRLVCSDRMSLNEAQTRISTDWINALKGYE